MTSAYSLEDWDALKFEYACINNNLEDLVRLIAKGVDVNRTRDKKGTTGLMDAMLRGMTDKEEIVKTLLKCPDIKIDIRDSDGWTALHHACFSNHDKGVRLFLAHQKCSKEIVLMKTNEGNTAEMFAKSFPACKRLVREYLARNSDLTNDVKENNTIQLQVEPLDLRVEPMDLQVEPIDLSLKGMK